MIMRIIWLFLIRTLSVIFPALSTSKVEAKSQNWCVLPYLSCLSVKGFTPWKQIFPSLNDEECLHILRHGGCGVTSAASFLE